MPLSKSKNAIILVNFFFLMMKMVNLLKSTENMSGMGLFHVKLFFSNTLNLWSGFMFTSNCKHENAALGVTASSSKLTCTVLISDVSWVDSEH